MDLIPLISIPAIFLLIALIKPYLRPKIPFNLCAICIAVAATWLALTWMWLAGSEVSPEVIAILMGMSIAGTMYKSETYYKTKNIQNFWLVRLTLITGGFYAIYTLLNKNWNALLLTLIGSIIIIAIAGLFFQGDKGKPHSLGYKRLDDCC